MARLRCRLLALGVGVLLHGTAPPCAATPFVPSDDSQVLEQLPSSPLDRQARQIKSLRQELTAQRTNITLATRLAWAHIEQGRRLSDPREYGYAQTALAPWWDMPTPPLPIRVLRATIRQHSHQFESALADLNAVLEADHLNTQAWLTRALIRQVRGEYAAAKEDCMQVLQLATPLVGVTCLSGVGSLGGEAQQSEQMLQRVLARPDAGDIGARLWALTVLAEIAARRHDPLAAEDYFRQALALGLHDDYLLGAYADFLLDQNRAPEVIAALADSTRADALLLRLALAEQATGSPELEAHVAMLRDRFAASRQRGEAVHGREEARYTLYLLKDPAAALVLAQRNWQVQHEPWDARILLECAVAAGDPRAATPVLEFLQRSGLEDVLLSRLSGRLGDASP